MLKKIRTYKTYEGGTTSWKAFLINRLLATGGMVLCTVFAIFISLFIIALGRLL